MPHLEPEELALAALGEPLDDAARDHLAACEQCTAEHAMLLATVSAGRAGRPGPDDLVAPPSGVWQAISAELGLDPAVQPGVRVGDEDPASGPAAAGRGGVVEPGGVADPPVTAEPPVAAEAPVSLADRRRPRPSARWLAAAAAAGVVLGGFGMRWWDQVAPTPDVLEQARLQALPDWPDASGNAVVEQESDGTRRLVISLAGAGAADGYHEVWLIDTGVTKLVSLGVLHGSEGSFLLPDGLDLTEYPVVDVSEEAFDGNPAHSGDSIVRGTLGA